MVMNAFDTNFDFGNEVYAVNTVGLPLPQQPDQGEARRARPHLPRQRPRVRPDQLLPPARELLPLLPDGDIARARGVHGHDQPGAGAARDPRAAGSRTRASTCSTPTRRNSPSWAGWASSRSRTDERRGGSAGDERRAAVAARPHPARADGRDRRDLRGARSAGARRAARPARRGPGGRQDRPPPRGHRAHGAQRRAGRGLGQAGHRQRRLRELHEQVRGDQPARRRHDAASTTPGSRARPTRSRC